MLRLIWPTSVARAASRELSDLTRADRPSCWSSLLISWGHLSEPIRWHADRPAEIGAEFANGPRRPAGGSGWNMSFPSSMPRFSITLLRDGFHQGNKDQA
jgi:hypothetical protein